MKNYFKILTNGLLKENPLLVLSIGLCSSLAVTTNMFSGLGMGLAMTFVLFMSELIISIFRKHIPDAIRLPVFIIIIAAFTTIVQLLLNAYLPALSDSLGVFLPLIVVNCIIMGRVEAFASKNNPLAAGLDAIGMGLGYTWVLVTISFFRELLGTGTIFGNTVFDKSYAIGFFSDSPGGFFVFGLLIALSLGIQKLAGNGKSK
ncbi:MAG: electron transport complex subunit RsxE [Treponema sp.]|uniref:electron transport complex subunit RsxE n=1 Tax=Treponema sp. TaxID=166 RepID=UPI001B66429A|nr:electron transport complex subunit RsxE [Treponema sp.]MBP5402176.1 electron transport complex subunit RsxE [Treponema sp.]MBR5933060.1 electron transport complex subunit RsxE [Treponema sp.]